MTEKLYDRDSYATEFDAVVLSCEETKKGYRILLDKTLFFPEEGGQSCDKGKLDGVEVTYVELCGEEIFHYCREAFETGKMVHGAIDFVHRYRNMQNHSGEHIICGIAHKLHECENVGFHLGADYVTMDLDKPLTQEEIDNIEVLANEAVYKNVSVSAYYPDKADLCKIDYRSKTEISGGVRLVNIDGYDVCACCAPHVARTGEIGIIKILDWINYKGGVRLNILCGADAVKDYDNRYRRNLRISNMLSAKQEEVCSAVERLLDEIGSLKQQLGEKSALIAKMYVDSVKNSDENICVFARDVSRDEMRSIVNGIKEKTQGVAAVLSGSDEAGYNYIICSDAIDLKAGAKELNTALSGRGGGTAQMISGTLGADRAAVEKYIMNMGK